MGFKLPKSSFPFNSPNKRADIGVIPMFDDAGEKSVSYGADKMTEEHKEAALSNADVDKITDENRLDVIKQLMRDKKIADDKYSDFTEENMFELDEKNEDGTWKYPDLHLQLAEINKKRTNVQLTDKDAISWMNYKKYKDEQEARQIQDRTERFEKTKQNQDMNSMSLNYFREHGHIVATGE